MKTPDRPHRSKQKPKLLSGGNPQIAKGDGDGPVQDYIAAMPGWKREVGEQLDALITHTVCLLYTSPSPRDLSTSRMPSSA